MFQVPLSGSGNSVVTFGTNISSDNSSINNLSVTSLSAVNFKTATFSPNQLNTSVLNVSAINLDPNFVFPTLNVTTLNSVKENFGNLSAVNISANQITCDNLQPLLTAGNNVSILNNTISVLNDSLPASANFSQLNVSQINASNLSTGDLQFGNNLTLNSKLLNVNSTNAVTLGSEALVTSGAVASALGTKSFTNLINAITQFRRTDIGIYNNGTVNAGQNIRIADISTKCRLGIGHKVSVEFNFAYTIGGFGTDSIRSRITQKSSAGTSNLVSFPQNWTSNDGGGTRSGTMSPITAVIDNTFIATGSDLTFELFIQNDADDTFQLDQNTITAKIIENVQANSTSMDLDLGSGTIKANGITANGIDVSPGLSGGNAIIGRTKIGGTAFTNMAQLSHFQNFGTNEYGFGQVANGITIMNSIPTSYNSFRFGNTEVASINNIGLGLRLGLGNTALFPLHVSGSAFIDGIIFTDEVEASVGDFTLVDAFNVSTTNMSATNVNISGTLTVNGTPFTTTNLQAGQNIIISNNVISAFVGSGSILNLSSIQVDNDVDIDGSLTVGVTSRFDESLNIGNTLFVGDPGQSEGDVVLFSNIVGNNYATKINSSTLELNCSATGTMKAINYFIGNNKALTINSSGINVPIINVSVLNTSNLSTANLAIGQGLETITLFPSQQKLLRLIETPQEAIDRTFTTGFITTSNVTINQFTTTRNLNSTINITTPLLNSTVGNFSSINISSFPDVVNTNISTINFSADLAYIENLNVSDQFTINNIKSETGLADFINISSRNISTHFLYASNSIQANKINVSTEIITGDLIADGLVQGNEMNASTLNVSTGTIKTINTDNMEVMNNMSVYNNLFVATKIDTPLVIATDGDFVTCDATTYTGNRINICTNNASISNASTLTITGIANLNTIQGNSLTLPGGTGNISLFNVSLVQCIEVIGTEFTFGLGETTTLKSELINVSVVNASIINGANLSTATMAIGQGLELSSFQNTLQLTQTPSQAIAELETAGINTTSVNTSGLNVDGLTTLDSVGISLSLQCPTINTTTINVSSAINASNINSSSLNVNGLTTLDGSLGIGINPPERLFHVRGANAIWRLDRDRPSPGLQLHRFDTNFVGDPLKGYIIGVNATGPNNGDFFINDYGRNIGGASTPRFSIQNEGQVIINHSLTTPIGNFSTINASNIVGYQESLIAGNNISIVGNTISSLGEPIPTDPVFETVTATTSVNTSFLIVDGTTQTQFATVSLSLQSPMINTTTINGSTGNFSSVTATTSNISTMNTSQINLITDGSDYAMNVSGSMTVRELNVSKALFLKGSDQFFGSEVQAPNNFGGPPRSRVNFWSSNASFEVGVRMGISEDNFAILRLESGGNVGRYNINISNFSTMDMDNASTKFHHPVAMPTLNVSTITASTITGFQPLLTAGTNISIVGNTISASGGGSSSPVLFQAFSSATSTINTIGATLPFNTILIDTDNAYDTGTQTYTIPVAGTYMLYCQFFRSGSTSYSAEFSNITTGTFLSRIQQNGDNGVTANVNGTIMATLNQGDQIRMRCTGGSVLLLSSNPNLLRTSWGGFLIK